MNDGGYAFPIAYSAHHGMSILDYFAAHALIGLLAQTEDVETDSGFKSYPFWECTTSDQQKRAACKAYEVAEAMLAERVRRLEGKS